MNKIEQSKNYEGKELDSLFFYPMLSGENAEELGIRVLYNMPVPTVLSFWQRNPFLLQKFEGSGWSGGEATDRKQKTINMSCVKAEASYSASDYFSLVHEKIACSPGINMQDLTGTELEAAETALFKEAIAQAIRLTMWLGDVDAVDFNTFNGFLKIIEDEATRPGTEMYFDSFGYEERESATFAEDILQRAWDNAPYALKGLKSEGNLVMFVSGDIYTKYGDSLDNADYESSFLSRQNGRSELYWRGIPVIDVKVGDYLDCMRTPSSFVILTDRRNLALAVNTADYPGTEVRMWYNPDEMENRQRAVFMAGCDILMPDLISYIRLVD